MKRNSLQPEVFPDFRNKKMKLDRWREREGKKEGDLLTAMYRCADVCGGWRGMVSCHFIISLLAANPITFPFSFLSWKIAWVTGLIGVQRYRGNCANQLIDITLALHCFQTGRQVRLVRLQGISELVRWTRSSPALLFWSYICPTQTLPKQL